MTKSVKSYRAKTVNFILAFTVPQQILYDNMKTAVIKNFPVEIRFNQKFEEFLAYYGVVPKACKPNRPQTKGK
ncbi:hypothetical protein M3212_21210 [Alkalihalobacillus oceani]|uniref:hypothetical protein n=1 Tax=Halalkalibacter oceani TaxID=1653776 RepID=UPI00203F2E07|nr:hypothetical protein [Halalkalibacter oceani]MCM3763233.1 hypothetical protein [Halalkalibacter oceani]